MNTISNKTIMINEGFETIEEFNYIRMANSFEKLNENKRFHWDTRKEFLLESIDGIRQKMFVSIQRMKLALLVHWYHYKVANKLIHRVELMFELFSMIHHFPWSIESTFFLKKAQCKTEQIDDNRSTIRKHHHRQT